MARKKFSKAAAAPKTNKPGTPAAPATPTAPQRASEIRIDFAGGAIIFPLHPGKTKWAELESAAQDWLRSGQTGSKVSMRYIAGSYGGNIALIMSRPSGAHYTGEDVINFLRTFGRKEMPEFFHEKPSKAPPSGRKRPRKPSPAPDIEPEI